MEGRKYIQIGLTDDLLIPLLLNVMTTETTSYNVLVPYTSCMTFEIELPQGLTDEEAYALLKEKYKELVDINTISFHELDKHDVMYELREQLNQSLSEVIMEQN